MRGYLKTLNLLFKLQPKTTTIGRHKDSDLCLQNSGVDEYHATIDWCEADSCYVIRDLNSTHGTYVNDCRIHNATVRLSPGDQLHFGYGGSTYELSIHSQKSFPHLAAQSPVPQAWVRAQTPSVSPHPPARPRPMSAGSRKAPNSPDRKSPSNRPGSWSGNTGRGCYPRSKTQPSNCQISHFMQKEEDEKLHGLSEGHVRVSVCFEDESQRKDDVITALKEEVSALKMQLSQKKQGDPDVTRRLRCLERDIKEKKDQIFLLKEQMLELQRCSGEMIGQAMMEKDQKISGLEEEMDKLRRENNSSAAQVSSLRRNVSTREKQALKLGADLDKLRQDVRQKEAKLTRMMDKLKDNQKIQKELLARQSEVESLKKEQASLLTERDTLKQLHEQRELRVQEELRHSQDRFDSFRGQIIKITCGSDKESDQKVLGCLSELMEQMEIYKTKVHDFEMKHKEEEHTQRKTLEETQKFRARLQECQSRVQDAGIADTVRTEISGLQDMTLSPAFSWVQEHLVSVLNLLHKVLHNTAQRLQEAGIDVTLKTGGVSGALRILCQNHKDVQSELKNLKSEMQKLQETEMQNRDLHRRLEQLELEKFQAAEGQKEIKNTLMRQLEEAVADLQSVRQTEHSLQREMETRKTEWQTKMEEAEIREAELKEKLCELHLKEEERKEEMKQCEEREVKALQRGAEEERERHRLELEEYREQVRQHAYTIVAMETRINKAQQSEERWREMEEERDSLKEQLKEALDKLEAFESNSTSHTSEKQQEPDQTITSLRASLVSSQQEVVSQSEVISALSRDLAQAHARLSDMTGDLSEQQKLELESHKALVIDQKIQLSVLTQKLTMMSQLLEKKDEEIKMLGEKLRQTEEELKSKTAANSKMENASLFLLQSSRNKKDVAVMTAPNDVINQGSKHKGHRRKEAILQQQEGLRDMRERIRALEQKWPSKRLAQQGEPEKQGQKKTHRLQRSAARSGSITSVNGFPFPEALTEAARERTARLDMTDALELSERTYLELARVLREALELSDGELSGCASLKHLPHDERQRIVSMRQTDLEFVRTRFDLQNSRSQQREQLLQENQREIHTLRDSQDLWCQTQVELESVKAELETQKQETEQLQQALQDSISQLRRNQQERGDTYRNNRGLSTEKADRRSGRVGHHNCIPNDSYEKTPAVKKRTSQMRLKKRESEVDNLKKEMGQKQQICSMVSELASPLKTSESSQLPLLTEAH